MRRFEAIKGVMETVKGEIVVCNLGHPSQELFMIKDRPQNFYMLASMGLASSIGLGLALSTEKKVVVLDGDGSMLMNLSSLATIGANQPKNYLLIIIDNGAYGSTGFQPTFTASGLKLDAVAQACTIQNTFSITQEAAITPVMEGIMRSDEGPYCVIIKAEKGMPDDLSIIPYEAITIRDRFMKSVEG